MSIPQPEFIAILEQELGLDPGSLSPDDQLIDVPDLDSLGRLSVIAMCDRQFGFVLNVPDLDACQTIADLYAFVDKHSV
jgi:acyl carrier protein